MSSPKVAGTALWLLCLPSALMTASCQQHQSQHVEAAAPDGNLQEVHDLIAATKSGQAAQIASNQLGAPIHVDPYPHAGQKRNDMAGMWHDAHAATAAPRH
jgi:hypothetical protein